MAALCSAVLPWLFWRSSAAPARISSRMQSVAPWTNQRGGLGHVSAASQSQLTWLSLLLATTSAVRPSPSRAFTSSVSARAARSSSTLSTCKYFFVTNKYFFKNIYYLHVAAARR